MVKRHASPTEDDVERYAETIKHNDITGQIQDRDSFEEAYEDYFTGSPELQENEKIKEKVFQEIQRLKPSISSDRIFTKAGGKSLRRDRDETADTVVSTEEEFKRRGARNVDLKGFDTKQRKGFIFPKKVKNQVVYARQVTIIIKGKRVNRFRDRRGRFTKN